MFVYHSGAQSLRARFEVLCSRTVAWLVLAFTDMSDGGIKLQRRRPDLDEAREPALELHEHIIHHLEQRRLERHTDARHA